VLGSEKGKLMESGLIMQQRKESEIVGWILCVECSGFEWKTWWYV
jgi:hypothetical protein